MSKFRIIPASHLPAQMAVLDIRNVPPASPSEGQRYIVGTGPSGAWTGMFHRIATYMDGSWVFDAPEHGWRTYVTALSKEYVFLAGVWSPVKELTWGMDYQMERGRFFYHREILDNDVEGDLRFSVASDDLHPYQVWEWRNQDYWQRENHQTVLEVTPSAPAHYDLTTNIDEFFTPYDGELPDKGVFADIEIQYWMNHYYMSESNPGEQTFHRTLAATQVLHCAILKTALTGSERWIVSGLQQVSARGSWAAYESHPTLYQALLATGVWDENDFPFIVSVVASGNEYQLQVDNDLHSVPDWEGDPDWRVTVQFRMRFKEMSTYDRTNEIVG